ncbi:DUF4386 domain-containing protein [Paenibacillus alginolyticus]|nr:DUF4386 family protein [Paenibacillus alginolyticus]
MPYPMYPYLGWKQQCSNVPVVFPPKHQNRHPGFEYLMNPRPLSENPTYVGSGKLKNKVAINTGGDKIHDWTFMLGPLFMLGINTMMYSYIFYKTKLVPRFISILGMTGATLVFICALLVMFGVIQQVSVWGAILACVSVQTID